MSNRIIGILGGMGPEATADLYAEIVRRTPAERDQDHLPVLIYSNPRIPERTPAILGSGEDPLPLMIETAEVLERAGAGILAIPCNTAHYFLPGLRKAVGIPILDMIGETAAELQRRWPAARSVGLLASSGTVRSGIYHRVFEERGVSVLCPDDADQERVAAGIAAVKAGRQDDDARRAFESIGRSLVARGAEAVILGCTEIPLAFDPEAAGYPVLNPTQVLAQAAVDWAVGKREA